MNLKSQYQGNSFIENDTAREVNKTVRRFLSEDITQFWTTWITHARKLKNFPNKKASGMNGTTNEELKTYPFPAFQNSSFYLIVDLRLIICPIIGKLLSLLQF